MIDLEESVYNQVRAKPLTRIHGRPKWLQIRQMAREMRKQAIKYRVSYDWAGNYGLQALVVGAARYATDHPLLPAYTRPTEPGNNPPLPGNASGLQIRLADGHHERRHQDWARVCGFVRGMGENVQDAVDEHYWGGLDDTEYGFLHVWPEDYINHFVAEFCPLDSQAIDEVKEHYKRGWNLAGNELLSKFGDRLDQEQEQFDRDGVPITDGEKYRHYIKQMYSSGRFTQDMVMEWIAKPAVQQTYANARAFFQGKSTNMSNAARLTGNTSATHGFGTAASATELKEIREAVAGAIKEAVAEAVAEERAGAEGTGSNTEQANAVNQLRGENKSLRDELATMSQNINRLTSLVGTLKNSVDQLKNNSPNGGDGGGDGGGSRKRGRNNGPNKEHPKHGKYTAGMAVDSSWPLAKKIWWVKCAKTDPTNTAAWKAYEKARLDKYYAEINS